MWGRVRQTLQVITAWIRPVDDDALAAEYLDPALLELFQTMRRSDRQHHLRVLKYLLKRGHNHPSLLVAALLHDVGKTRTRLTIIDRILAVLVKALLPRRFERWSQSEPRGWRRAFVVSAYHPIWGAEMIIAAGGEPLAADLTRFHQTSPGEIQDDNLRDLLIKLQAADDVS